MGYLGKVDVCFDKVVLRQITVDFLCREFNFFVNYYIAENHNVYEDSNNKFIREATDDDILVYNMLEKLKETKK